MFYVSFVRLIRSGRCGGCVRLVVCVVVLAGGWCCRCGCCGVARCAGGGCFSIHHCLPAALVVVRAVACVAVGLSSLRFRRVASGAAAAASISVVCYAGVLAYAWRFHSVAVVSLLAVGLLFRSRSTSAVSLIG